MTLATLGDERWPEVRAAAGDCLLSWPLAADDAGTVARARTLVRTALTGLGFDASAAEDGETMTAELVGNAVRHGLPPIELRVGALGDGVLVAVLDGSPKLPSWPSRGGEQDALAAAGDDLDQLIDGLSERGRGLGLVNHLAQGRCGARRARTGGGRSGKVTWFAQPRPAGNSRG